MNIIDKDGCSSTCGIEVDFTCLDRFGTSICKVCGDGRLDEIEECDDGDNDDEDGCSSTCHFEEDFKCTTVPHE